MESRPEQVYLAECCRINFLSLNLSFTTWGLTDIGLEQVCNESEQFRIVASKFILLKSDGFHRCQLKFVMENSREVYVLAKTFEPNLHYDDFLQPSNFQISFISSNIQRIRLLLLSRR